ncbi:MAG TPA: Mur ligase domain-containing protein, partial [Bacteroidia bacterium]|nr:Mur ligase domain-containing protein [Bacteroidia bacterium]
MLQQIFSKNGIRFMNFSANQVSNILSAKLIGKQENSFLNIITDSRTAGFTAQALFVAIKGERHNGHIYIKDLYQQGCRCFLVSEEHAYYKELSDASFLIVEDTLLALQQLSAHKRSLFKMPVVGITGSNGKTIVKEW